MDYAALADGIAGWLRARMTGAAVSRLVVGLSGGIDSAVVCALCTMAAGSSRVIAAILPIHSAAADLRDAESSCPGLRSDGADHRPRAPSTMPFSLPCRTNADRACKMPPPRLRQWSVASNSPSPTSSRGFA